MELVQKANHSLFSFLSLVCVKLCGDGGGRAGDKNRALHWSVLSGLSGLANSHGNIEVTQHEQYEEVEGIL